MAKTVTILNHSNNPFMVTGLDGQPVFLPLEGSVEVSEVEAAKLVKYKGLIDASKYVKPTSAEAELRAKNAALEAELKALKDKNGKHKDE